MKAVHTEGTLTDLLIILYRCLESNPANRYLFTLCFVPACVQKKQSHALKLIKKM